MIYSVLELLIKETDLKIKIAYRKLSRKKEPDRNNHEKTRKNFHRLLNAHSYLMNVKQTHEQNAVAFTCKNNKAAKGEEIKKSTPKKKIKGEKIKKSTPKKKTIGDNSKKSTPKKKSKGENSKKLTPKKKIKARGKSMIERQVYCNSSTWFNQATVFDKSDINNSKDYFYSNREKKVQRNNKRNSTKTKWCKSNIEEEPSAGDGPTEYEENRPTEDFITWMKEKKAYYFCLNREKKKRKMNKRKLTSTKDADNMWDSNTEEVFYGRCWTNGRFRDKKREKKLETRKYKRLLKCYGEDYTLENSYIQKKSFMGDAGSTVQFGGKKNVKPESTSEY